MLYIAILLIGHSSWFRKNVYFYYTKYQTVVRQFNPLLMDLNSVLNRRLMQFLIYFIRILFKYTMIIFTKAIGVFNYPIDRLPFVLWDV